MVFLIRDISFTWGREDTLSPVHPVSRLTCHLSVSHVCLTSLSNLSCLSHLFSDVLSQLSQDLVEDDELTNQSLGVLT